MVDKFMDPIRLIQSVSADEGRNATTVHSQSGLHLQRDRIVMKSLFFSHFYIPK